MAKLNFDAGSVWDNTVTGSNKYSTKVPAQAATKGPVMSAGSARALRLVPFTFDFDASYPTGGEDISGLWDAFPRGQVLGIFVVDTNVLANATGVKDVRPDYAAKKLIAYTTFGGGTQVTNATNLSGVTGIRMLAIGY